MAPAAKVCVNVNRVKWPYDCGRAQRAFTARPTCQRRSELPSAGMLTAPGSLLAPCTSRPISRRLGDAITEHRLGPWVQRARTGVDRVMERTLWVGAIDEANAVVPPECGVPRDGSARRR